MIWKQTIIKIKFLATSFNAFLSDSQLYFFSHYLFFLNFLFYFEGL